MMQENVCSSLMETHWVAESSWSFMPIVKSTQKNTRISWRHQRMAKREQSALISLNTEEFIISKARLSVSERTFDCIGDHQWLPFLNSLIFSRYIVSIEHSNPWTVANTQIIIVRAILILVVRDAHGNWWSNAWFVSAVMIVFWK